MNQTEKRGIIVMYFERLQKAMRSSLTLALVAAGAIAVAGFALFPQSVKNVTRSQKADARMQESFRFEKEASRFSAVTDWASAEAKLKSAVKIWPDNLSAKHDLGEAYLRQGKKDEAYDTYKEVFQKGGWKNNRNQMLYAFSELCKERGDVERQQAALNEILTTAQGNVRTSKGSGEIATALADQSRFYRLNGSPVPPIQLDKPESMSTLKGADGTLNNESMAQIYVAVAKNCLLSDPRYDQPDLARELLLRAIALKSDSLPLRYKMAELCDQVYLGTEKKSLLVSISQSPGAYTETKFLAQKDLGLLKAVVVNGKPVRLGRLPSDVAVDIKRWRQREGDDLKKRARQWDYKNNRPIPWKPPVGEKSIGN